MNIIETNTKFQKEIRELISNKVKDYEKQFDNIFHIDEVKWNSETVKEESGEILTREISTNISFTFNPEQEQN
ncbi:hypothetical protein [Flavobacterium filum]|uniref:hypothetical protein n=1 Tax=Flavobacterium filum TaxID=370974 RepID=UPI0023F180D6|nr:hypothetical protein [Flavobacterium filum]